MATEMVASPVLFETPFLSAAILLRGVLEKVEASFLGGAEIFNLTFVLSPDVPANLTRISKSFRGELAFGKRALLKPLLFPLFSHWYIASLGELLPSFSP